MTMKLTLKTFLSNISTLSGVHVEHFGPGYSFGKLPFQ